MGSDQNIAVRADKWLWAARFYKTRALAIQAITGGKVHLNGGRIKPAHRLNPGDTLTIRKGPYTFSIRVERLATQRRPAEEARTLYSESEESAAERHALYRQRKLEGHSVHQHERRPDKRTRRRIRQFKQH
ncbi:MAG: RNA-binding S4 domain-containing protein [Gammaproteobacteria bacterium]|nr:RNA-binding S4 domain-containing protein [Gammaproteobacteria bacterium]MDH3559898.1 RNA-binding S4 domain-containing protein [Gammaproteobacteria bacterium]